MRVIESNEWLLKVEMEVIKRNIEMENSSDRDLDKSVRDANGGRGMEMDVAAEVDRTIDRKVQQDDLDGNAKKILTNKVEKMKEPMNLEVVNFRNVVRKRRERENTSNKSSVESDPRRKYH